MIRSLWLIGLLLLTVAVSLYALTTREPPADFTYVNPSGIHTLDPARMSWTQDIRVALNIWEGLTTTNPRTTKPIQGAALFPPRISPDGLIYTFTIRREARWSNGDPVTAADFVRGWRRGMEPGTATDYTFLFTDHIAGADDYVRFRREGVAVLTALVKLCRGATIDAKQAHTLARHPLTQRFLKSHSPPRHHNDILWLQENLSTERHSSTEVSSELADRERWKQAAVFFNGLSVDWQSVYDEVFRHHVAEMDRRFDQVGIQATDDHTLVVGLRRPCPYFLDLTAFPTFLPCHRSIERLRMRFRGSPLTEQGLVVYDPQWTKPDYHRRGYPGLITNGPYRLADWKFKRRVRLLVNPYYAGANRIRCRTIDMLVYENVSASLMAYEAGDVDFLPSMDVPYDHEIARLAQTGARPDFHLCMVLATYFLNFNCRNARVLDHPNPFVDRRVRKAFALAIDKRAIVEKVLQRGDRVANSFVPAGSIAGYDPPKGLTWDPDEARRLLAEAGYADGSALGPIDFLCVASDERVCQALARMWEETLGVQIELRSKETKTFAEDKAHQRYMIARGNWYADYDDPTTFLDCLRTGNGNNDSGYRNPRYDALLDRADQSSDSTHRMALLQQAESIILREDVPILPILHYAQPIAIKPYVQGLYPNARLRFPFRYVSVHR